MLDVRRLNAWYGESHILHDVDLGVGTGQRIAILGRNGAGKSTLLKSIMNSEPRVAGTVQFMGRSLETMPSFRRARLGIALVPEDRRIFNHVTVEENIEFARFSTRDSRRGLAMSEVLSLFPMLEPLRRRLGGQLSGGQQQMLAVARAIAAQPRLLLLDEPTEGLAPVIVEQLAQQVVATCQQQSMALVLAEQNIWFARQCAERVYIISAGKIVFEGDWHQFDSNHQVVHRYLSL